MTSMHAPRLEHIDRLHAATVLHNFEAQRERTSTLMKSEPGRLSQTRYLCLADEHMEIGLFRYGLGHPFEEIREAFRQAAQAYMKVFELRGTEEPFDVTLVTYDPKLPPDDPASILAMRALHPPGSKDYSVTCSRNGLEAVYVALVGDEPVIAERLAAMIWDPPDADYIGPSSETCTPNQQHLAYAVKHLFANDMSACVSELGSVRAKKRETDVRVQAEMVRALAENRDALFLESLCELLAWHKKHARREENRTESEFYLSMPGLALSILAIRRGLVRTDQLPHDNVYLPLELTLPN